MKVSDIEKSESKNEILHNEFQKIKLDDSNNKDIEKGEYSSINNKEKDKAKEIDNDDDIKKCCVFGFTLIYMCIFILPFAICDLYYSYNQISCQNIVSPNMDLTIGIWLKVNGYLLLSILFIPVLIFFENKYIKIIIPIIFVLVRIFVLSWLIVGAVLFWRDIEPMNKCSKRVNSYIWVRLIIGLVTYFIELKSNNNKK
jgi:hypothetical protein